MAKQILKLNAISPLADAIFAGYGYGDSCENPDGIMVRSAQMADYKPGDRLVAVARAGAGTNNIPVADYAEKGIVVFNTPDRKSTRLNSSHRSQSRMPSSA